MPVGNLIQIRRDTAANWTATNPILANGEFGLETDTGRQKKGDGIVNWNVLDYDDPKGYLAKSVTGAVNVTLTLSEAGHDIIEMTGIPTANISLIVPNSPRRYWIVNSTSGAFTVTVKTAAGTGIATMPGLQYLLYSNGTDVRQISQSGSLGNLPPLSRDNHTITNSVVDVDHDMIWSASILRDRLNRGDINDSGGVKQLDAIWAPGTNVGGLASAAFPSLPNTDYHLFTIGKVNGQTERGYDTNLSAANLLTDAGPEYVYFRRVGSVSTDGANHIRPCVQKGHYFHWVTPIREFNAGTGAGTLASVSTPLGVNCKVTFNSHMATDSGVGYYSPTFTTNMAASRTVAPLASIGIVTATPANNEQNSSQVTCMTDTSSQIRLRGGTIRVSCLFYEDFIGD